MVGIADTRQTVVVVGIGNHLAFLRHVRRLLGEHVAERVVGKRRRHVALGVRHPHETWIPSYSNVVVISPSGATMLDELCELPMSQYDLARNMSYLVSYMNSIVS